MPSTPSSSDNRQPLRNIRVSQALWDRALAATKAEHTSASAVCVDALTTFCERVEVKQAAAKVATFEARLARAEHLHTGLDTPAVKRPTARKTPAPRKA